MGASDGPWGDIQYVCTVRVWSALLRRSYTSVQEIILGQDREKRRIGRGRGRQGDQEKGDGRETARSWTGMMSACRKGAARRSRAERGDREEARETGEARGGRKAGVWI